MGGGEPEPPSANAKAKAANLGSCWVAFMGKACKVVPATLQVQRATSCVPLQCTVVASVVLRPVKGCEGCFGMMCTVVHCVCIHHRCGALGVGLLWLAGFCWTRCHGCCLASVLCSTTLRLPVARRRSTGRGLSFPRRFPGTDGRRFPSRAETVGVGRWGALRFRLRRWVRCTICVGFLQSADSRDAVSHGR